MSSVNFDSPLERKTQKERPQYLGAIYKGNIFELERIKQFLASQPNISVVYVHIDRKYMKIYRADSAEAENLEPAENEV